MKKPSETALVRACLDLLKLRGVLAWRNNTGAAEYTDRWGKSRMVKYGSVGSADIFGIISFVDGDGMPHDGVFLAVECKMPGKNPTAAQTAFLDNVRKAGGEAHVVHDVAELAAILDDLLS